MDCAIVLTASLIGASDVFESWDALFIPIRAPRACFAGFGLVGADPVMSVGCADRRVSASSCIAAAAVMGCGVTRGTMLCFMPCLGDMDFRELSRPALAIFLRVGPKIPGLAARFLDAGDAAVGKVSEETRTDGAGVEAGRASGCKESDCAINLCVFNDLWVE